MKRNVQVREANTNAADAESFIAELIQEGKQAEVAWLLVLCENRVSAICNLAPDPLTELREKMNCGGEPIGIVVIRNEAEGKSVCYWTFAEYQHIKGVTQCMKQTAEQFAAMLVAEYEFHECACPVCLGPAEHCIMSNGYEDIECREGCGLVWLRGDPTNPSYFIDKRPDKRKMPCDRCNGLTIH